MMFQKILNKYNLGLILVFVGLDIGISISPYIFLMLKPPEQIALQFDVTALLGIVINTFLVIYVAGILTKKIDQDKAEKDLLIKKLEKFESYFDHSIENIFLQDEIPYIKVASTIKMLRMNNSSIEKILQSHYNTNQFGIFFQAIDAIIQNIRDKLTGGDSDIVGGIIRNSEDAKQLVKSSQFEINRIAFSVVVKINRGV